MGELVTTFVNAEQETLPIAKMLLVPVILPTSLFLILHYYTASINAAKESLYLLSKKIIYIYIILNKLYLDLQNLFL